MDRQPARQRQRTSGQGGKARGQQRRTPRYLQQSPTPWKRFTAQPFRPLIRCRTSSKRAQKKSVSAGRLTTELTPLFDQESYCDKVEQVKHYIHEGDIFQLVLSNRLEAGFDGSLLDTYRILRTKNPSPYMFYFSSDDLEIAALRRRHW